MFTVYTNTRLAYFTYTHLSLSHSEIAMDRNLKPKIEVLDGEFENVSTSILL